MKILLPLILLFTCFLLRADNVEVLTVKYDKKYYSPCGNVEKFDITLPKDSKQKYYFIKIKRLFSLGAHKIWDNFERTFAVNKDGSLYIYLERKENMTGLNISLRFEEKQDINWSTDAPKCRDLYCYAAKHSSLDYGQKVIIANYTNKRETYKSGDYYEYISGSLNGPEKSQNFSFKIYLTLIRKPKDNNYFSLFKTETKTDYNFPNGYLKKLGKEDLVKLRDKIMQEREAGLEELAQDRTTPGKLWYLTRKYYEVMKALKEKEQNIKPRAHGGK